MYLDKAQKQKLANLLADLAPTNIRRVIFDAALGAAMPRALAQKYPDASDALAEAFQAVASFEQLLEPEGEPVTPVPAPAPIDADEIPF